MRPGATGCARDRLGCEGADATVFLFFCGGIGSRARRFPARRPRVRPDLRGGHRRDALRELDERGPARWVLRPAVLDQPRHPLLARRREGRPRALRADGEDDLEGGHAGVERLARDELPHDDGEGVDVGGDGIGGVAEHFGRGVGGRPARRHVPLGFPEAREPEITNLWYTRVSEWLYPQTNNEVTVARFVMLPNFYI